MTWPASTGVRFINNTQENKPNFSLTLRLATRFERNQTFTRTPLVFFSQKLQFIWSAKVKASNLTSANFKRLTESVPLQLSLDRDCTVPKHPHSAIRNHFSINSHPYTTFFLSAETTSYLICQSQNCQLHICHSCTSRTLRRTRRTRSFVSLTRFQLYTNSFNLTPLSFFNRSFELTDLQIAHLPTLHRPLSKISQNLFLRIFHPITTIQKHPHPHTGFFLFTKTSSYLICQSHIAKSHTFRKPRCSASLTRSQFSATSFPFFNQI